MSVFGLVLLILLSPCKVRNFIQAELGVPQTKVLNKSQTTISHSNCQSIEVSESIQADVNSSVQQPDLLNANTYRFELIFVFSKQFLTQSTSSSKLVADVPLYILHQRFQVYS